jgi:hypothetical protein
MGVFVLSPRFFYPETMACANHVCDSTTAASIACPHCHGVAYCSEQCRVIDWVKHDCANVTRVADPAETRFVPYYFQDHMTDAERGPIPAPGTASPLLESHMLVHYGTDQTRTVREIPSLIAADSQSGWRTDFVTPTIGTDPDRYALAGEYTIRAELLDNSLEGNTIKFKDYVGTFTKNTIYKGNTDEDVARLLANKPMTTESDSFGKRAKEAVRRFASAVAVKTAGVSTSVLFWPKINFAEALSLPATGNLRVSLYVRGVLVTHIRGGFDLRKVAAMSKLSAITKTAFEVRVKSKFKHPEGLYPYQAVVADVIATSTFKIAKAGTEGTLRDIELVVPEMTIHAALNDNRVPVKAEAIQSEYRCNPRVFEQLMGLVLAAEATTVSNKAAAADETLQHNAGIVRSYTRNIQDKLQCVAPADVPMEVNTAVHFVTHALYDYNVAVEK